jgi:NAD(P)-dependent dehydrogenase (short-subunit alcohol dehydrogenase family)
MNDLTDKIALVTGSGQGLGKGIALVLAEKGADIILNDRNQQTAETVASEISKMKRQVLVVQADVSDPQEVESMFEEIKQKFGRLDILVNNAGTSQAKDIFDIDMDDWQFIIQNNLTSHYLCSKGAMELMKPKKSGRIVNISSVVGQQGALFGHVHYASTKAGILGFTKTLARTAAPLGITVNAIAPGIIETELLFKVHGQEGVKKLSKTVPLGLGTPRDIGLTVAFLCSEGGRYITGATLDVNGGLYMR